MESDFVKVHRSSEHIHSLGRPPAKRPRNDASVSRDTNGAPIGNKFRVNTSEDAYSRHQALMRQYNTSTAAAHSTSTEYRTETEILQAKHQFIRDEAKDARDSSWETRVAVKYYRRLFKEYALADLSRYKESKVGLRWRTEKEVVIGKGQFICGNKRCDERTDLHSYEVPFRYEENGERKLELVKVRVCPACAKKLFYEKIKQMNVSSSVGLSSHRDIQRLINPQAAEDTPSDDDDEIQDPRKILPPPHTRPDPPQPKQQQQTAEETQQKQEQKQQAQADSRGAWIGPQAEERTRDDDIDDYFSDLFM